MERDREVLSGRGARSNYATDENLAKRQSIFAYLDPQTSTPGAPIDRAPWRAGETVLDIGCGNGLWLAAAWREARWAVGLDLSEGMLSAARATVSPAVAVVRADAQVLPVAPRSFDGALAMHMLYHVADLGAALAEIVRVLRPGGWVLIATNRGVPTRSAELYHEAVETATGERFDYILPAFDFDGESAPRLLMPYFEMVDSAEHGAGFKVTDPGALLGPLDSVREPVEATIGRPVSWPDAFAYVTSKAAEEIRDTGGYRYEQRVFSFLCRTVA